jgi:acyl-coenzyme A synthetase/AMP-(fatty) acid ligase
MTTLLPANRLASTIAQLRDDYPDSVVVGDFDADEASPAAMRIIDPRSVVSDAGPAEPVPDIDMQLAAAIVFTSGSTGPGSAIHKSWATLVESSKHNARALGAEGMLRHLVATMPPQHMWGLETSVLIPWFAPVAASHQHPFFPGAIVEALHALPHPRILASTPTHLRSLAAYLGEEPLPAESLWCATAPLDPNLAVRLAAGGATRITEVYGCSETGCLARRDPVTESDWQALDGFTLRTVAGGTDVDAAHLPGTVRLRDEVVFADNGRFRLIGRDEDLINIAGKRASLADLNQRLLRLPGIVDGVVFLPPGADGRPAARLAALVVAPELTAAQIRAGLRAVMDAAFVPRPIRRVQALPRAESGKLPRQWLLEAFHATQDRTDANI